LISKEVYDRLQPIVPKRSKKHSTPDGRDYLLRGLPTDLADKVKVAASLHRTSMKEYILDILQKHVAELERKGIGLALPKGK
jgi:hypothetical protein